MSVIVTVYSAGPNCMACRQTKRHMEKRGIAFSEEVLSDSALAAAQFLGCRAAPVVAVTRPDGTEEVWDGYRPDRIDGLMAS